MSKKIALIYDFSTNSCVIEPTGNITVTEIEKAFLRIIFMLSQSVLEKTDCEFRRVGNVKTLNKPRKVTTNDQ